MSSTSAAFRDTCKRFICSQTADVPRAFQAEPNNQNRRVGTPHEWPVYFWNEWPPRQQPDVAVVGCHGATGNAGNLFLRCRSRLWSTSSDRKGRGKSGNVSDRSDSTSAPTCPLCRPPFRRKFSAVAFPFRPPGGQFRPPLSLIRKTNTHQTLKG